jgi:hypothetical protein
VCSLQSQSPSSDTNHSLCVHSRWLLGWLLPAQVDREFRRNMTMNIDITIAMKCNYLGADYVDVSGETRPDLTLSFSSLRAKPSHLRTSCCCTSSCCCALVGGSRAAESPPPPPCTTASHSTCHIALTGTSLTTASHPTATSQSPPPPSPPLHTYHNNTTASPLPAHTHHRFAAVLFLSRWTCVPCAPTQATLPTRRRVDCR